MSVRTESNQTIRDEAAYWTTQLVSGESLSEIQLQTFHSWLAQPPNERAFREYQSMKVLIQDQPKNKRAALVEQLPVPHPRLHTLRT